MKAPHASAPSSSHTSVQKTLCILIHEIKGMGLEAGRNLALEELRTLQIDPRQIDRILRQVAEARSIDGLVASLESFATTIHHTPLHRVKE